MAVRLYEAIGRTPATWLGMQSANDLWPAREIAVKRFFAALCS